MQKNSVVILQARLCPLKAKVLNQISKYLSSIKNTANDEQRTSNHQKEEKKSNMVFRER